MAKQVISAIIAALAAGVTPSLSTAQSWAVVDAPGRTQAATVQWPVGVGLLARCAPRRGLDILLTLVRPVAHPTVNITFGFDDDERSEQVWRLSQDGAVLFVRQPATFARSLFNAETFSLLVEPTSGPRQRYELESPDGMEILENILSACGHSTEPLATDNMITDPDWVRLPTGEQFANFYPVRRGQPRVNGSAIMQCRVAVNGTLDDCIIVSESPAGAGFGAATLGLARFFQMHPKLVNGEPVPEALVSIPVNWRIGD